MKKNYNSKLLSQKRFGKYAQGYVDSKTHALGKELDHLIEIVKPQSDWIILDVATGGGHTALKFSPFVAKVYASDITEDMLNAAQVFIKKNGVNNVFFKIADAENLPFENCKFDLVTCRIAAHHFLNCSDFVIEAFRVLKNGGVLLIQDHVLPEDKSAARYIDTFEKTRDPSHNRGYSQSEWLAMFQNAGLNVEHKEKIIKKHKFIPWSERQGCSLEIIEKLILMVEQADETIISWLQPQKFRTDEATFVNHHIIIAGRKNHNVKKIT